MKSANAFKDKLDTVKKELVYVKTKETTQNEAQREKTMAEEKRAEWKCLTCLIGVLKEVIDNGTEATFNEIMAGNLSALDLNLRIQEAWWITRRLVKRKPHIVTS